jgi:hypothetical protein
MRYLALLLAAGLLAGCSPADAQKAEDILRQAQAAQQALTSESFVLKLSFSYEGQSAEIVMQGAGYTKTGDFYMTMTGSVPGLSSAPFDLAVVKRGGTVQMRQGGRTETLSLPQAQQQLGGTIDQFSQLTDLARYVKDGSVSAADFQGRPADKLVGVLDTQALFSAAAGSSKDLFSRAGVHVGDLRVVLFVPRDTHLVEAMLADVTLNAQGKSVAMNLSLGLTGVNQPVEFPTL